MNTALLEEVKAFVAEFWSESPNRISAETSINDDLGIDGDDGEEFLQAFCDRFAVDLSMFPHEKYFGPEAAANPISLIVCAMRRVTTGSWSGLSPLTVGDLVKAVESSRQKRSQSLPSWK